MRITRRRGLLLSALLTLVVLATIGAASAYWNDPPPGAGTAGTGTVQPVTLTPGTPTAQLYPGGTAGVTLTVTNPNTIPVTVTSLALDPSQGTGGYAVDGAHSACGVGSLTFATPQNNGGPGWAIAGSGTPSITMTNALSMSANAGQACQGATISVYLTAGS
jgi:hypothetical protein